MTTIDAIVAATPTPAGATYTFNGEPLTTRVAGMDLRTFRLGTPGEGQQGVEAAVVTSVLDVLHLLVQGRRGDNATVWQSILTGVRARPRVAAIRELVGQHAYRFGDAHRRAASVLAELHRRPLGDVLGALRQPWSTGPSQGELETAFRRSLELRSGAAGPVVGEVRVTSPEVILSLPSGARFRVNLSELVVVAEPYAPPTGGERFTAGGVTYLIASGAQGCVSLTTGEYLPLEGGAPAGLVLGETFTRVNA